MQALKRFFRSVFYPRSSHLLSNLLTYCMDHYMNPFFFCLCLFLTPFLSLCVCPWLGAGPGKFDKIMNCHACCSFSHFTAQ